MSLIEEMKEDFVILNKVKVSDGEGGFNVEWQDGAEIQAVLVNDTSMVARIAEQQGVSSTYTITTDKTIQLEFHDVLKRVKDGSVYRVTSNSIDKQSPSISTLDISQVKAEKWELSV